MRWDQGPVAVYFLSRGEASGGRKLPILPQIRGDVLVGTADTLFHYLRPSLIPSHPSCPPMQPVTMLIYYHDYMKTTGGL